MSEQRLARALRVAADNMGGESIPTERLVELWREAERRIREDSVVFKVAKNKEEARFGEHFMNFRGSLKGELH